MLHSPAYPSHGSLQVAVKVIEPSEASAEDLARVVAEVQVSEQLAHPHLVRTYTHSTIRCGATAASMHLHLHLPAAMAHPTPRCHLPSYQL